MNTKQQEKFCKVPYRERKKGRDHFPNKPKEIPSIWDPLGEKVFQKKFQRSRKKLFKIFERYKKNPNTPRRNVFLFSIPLFLLVAVGIYDHEIILTVISVSPYDYGILGLLVFASISLPVYFVEVFQIQRDLIKILIAEKRGWIYSPDERKGRWKSFEARFPRFFQKGDEGQNIQNEFWGDFQGTHFWTGIFEYTEVHRIGEDTYDTTHQKTLFSMPLSQKLTTTFQLIPEGVTQKLFSFFGKKDIDVESTDFNKTFTVLYDGKKVEHQQEIVKILSPSLQVRLLNLQKEQGSFSVLFQENLVFYSFSGKLLKHMKSNFFRKVALDPRDEEKINTRLNNILKITNDILPFLR